MLINKSKAAELAGVSRRTFYNHIPKKKISVVVDDDGVEKIELSELERVYGKERILQNRKKLEDASSDTGKAVQPTQPFTQNNVHYEKLILEEKLKGAEALIEQLKSEREQLLDDKKHMQEQLEKALEIGVPIGKLLTDQRETKEGRAVVERKAIEESLKRENAEKRLKAMSKKLKSLRAENDTLKGRGLIKKLFG